MKRNAIFLFLVIAVVFGLFSLTWSQCPEEPNDPGQCDTLYVEPWLPDLHFDSPGDFVRVPLYVTHDVMDPLRDSIAGFFIPLCFTHTNPAKYCSLTAYWNTTVLSPPNLPRSIFRHLPSNDDPQVHNWMMDLYQAENGEEWDYIVLDLDGISHFWLTMFPSGVNDQRFGEGSGVLLATMTFKVEDVMQICVDKCFWSPLSDLAFVRSDMVTYVPRDNLPNCFSVSTEPVGSISGTMFNDINGDGVQDPDEVGLPNWMVTLNIGHFADMTDADGNYFFGSLPPNTYTISEVHKLYWEQTCPDPPGTYDVTLEPEQTVTGKDFGNRIIPNIQDLSVTVAGGTARPGFQKHYGLHYQNKGTVVTNGIVKLTLDPQVEWLQSSPGGDYNAIDHSVTWDVGALPLEFVGWLWTDVQIPADVQIGTILTSTATIEPIAGDANSADNTDMETQTVRGSYDPNEKLVTPQGVIFRSDTLRYQINFQNVGTDTAFNIVVRDTLDINLDITTLESGASSHPYALDITGRELSWTFANINLPDSITSEPKSHGFVTFRVQPMSDAPDGADIQNQGEIYFDFNQPVITNIVHSRIYLCGDANSDGVVDVGDIVYLINYLFKGGFAPNPINTGDANSDGIVDVSDVVYLLNYLFRSGPAPSC
jgi:hypothetical protein